MDDLGVYETVEVDEFFEKYFKGEDASKLSPIIDISAQRFNSELEFSDEEKADYKIKAKQFVKIYSQMASIMPYEIVAWEKLFWFLKFLIPKMIIKDKDQDMLDELLNSVDLSTYGLERVKLGVSIELDESETELEPQNPNPRGAYTDKQKDLLDTIIENFNQKWFSGWAQTPQESREKFLYIIKKVKEHKDFEAKYQKNQDSHTRKIALDNIIKEVMNQNRKRELDLYRLYANEDEFKTSMSNSIDRILSYGIGITAHELL